MRPPVEWPQFPDASFEPLDVDPEIKFSVNIVQTEECPGPLEALLERRSSLSLIERATAWVLRFITNSRKTHEERVVGPLLIDEIKQAKIQLAKCAQRAFFGDELDRIVVKKAIDKGSRLRGVTPFVDENGLLRVGGRLINSPLTYDGKHPLILPPGHRLTELNIHRIHQECDHSSVERTLAEFRTIYWAPKLRATINKIVHRCIMCRKRQTQPSVPLMAALPAHRIQAHNPAFTNIGVNMFGPLFVTILRRNVKRYGLLIT